MLKARAEQRRAGAGEDPARRHNERIAAAVILAVTVLLAVRLLVFIRRWDVNLLASDDWNYLDPIFQGASVRRIYFFNYNLVHEGLGLVLGKFVLECSRWSTTVFSEWLAGVMLAACCAALWLKRRLVGRWETWDVAIPCIFLTLRQYEIFISSHNPSSQAFPVLMVVLYCAAWMVRRRELRYLAVIAMNALAIDGGYAYFIGFLTPVLFAIEAMRAWRDAERRGAATALAGAAISTAWMGAFFWSVRPGSGVECLRPNAWSYVEYMALMFANNLGLRGATAIALIVGLTAFAITVAVFMLELRTLFSADDGIRRELAQAVVALTGFGLLISAATALGRACYAMEFAQSSRYVPYLIPAFLGVYLRVAASRPVRPRTAAMAAILVSAATAAMWLGPQDRAILHWLSDSKRAWRACYLQREDIRGCDAAANFVLLPTPEQFHMREKMEFLKRNRLNLYAP